MTLLKQAAALAKKERSASKNGRTRYSTELKNLLASAAKEASKTRLAKETGISYPTILKFVGSKPRKAATKGTKATSRQALGSNVSVAISVELPSNTTLQYSSVKGLIADAKALSKAVQQVS